MRGDMRRAVWALVLAVLGAGVVRAQSIPGPDGSAGETFHDDALGFAITKPPGWHFATAEHAPPTSRMRADGRSAVLVVLVRDVNAPPLATPSIVINRSERNRRAPARETVQRMAEAFEWLSDDLTLVERARTVRLGGRRAGYAHVRLPLLGGIGGPTLTDVRVWVVPDGRYQYTTFATLPEADAADQANVERTMASIRLSE